MDSLDSYIDNPIPVSAIVVSPTGSQAESSKKCGRPKLSEAKDTASWSDAMVEALLEARRANLSSFLNAKDKKAIIRGWSKVALSFNTVMQTSLPIDKIKSKYQYLQKTYRSISQAEMNTTGNVRLPKKPSFFDALVNHFGGRQGMAHHCLSSSEMASFPDHDEDALDSEEYDENFAPGRELNFSSPPVRSAARVAKKGSKNDIIVEVGQDIKDGLVIMSDRIASALTIPQPSFNNDIQEIKTILKEQARQNGETNEMLRAFMEAMMKRQ